MRSIFVAEDMGDLASSEPRRDAFARGDSPEFPAGVILFQSS
jgi:hypothetical protein